jgi:glycosyltransferase involved in cell wall biosynthesis
MLVSIIIPVFNEQKTILEILKRVNAQKIKGVKFEIIVVNDGSTDQTINLLMENKSLYNRLIDLSKNKGKGAAIKAGILSAKGSYILFQDGDLEYDPVDYKNLLEPIIRFNADLVLGSRLLGPPITRVSYFWNKQGNKVITLLFNLFYNTTFTDIYSCYLIYRRSLFNVNILKTEGWEQQAEILSKVVLNSRRHYEVPVNYYGRSYDEGKKIRPYHIFKIIFTIISKRFFR